MREHDTQRWRLPLQSSRAGDVLVRDLKYWRLSTDIQRMSEGVRGAVPDQVADASSPPGPSLSPLHDAELRAQWEQTFVSTTRGITITNPISGIIESTNPAFAAMHGGTVEDFVGQPAINALSPEAQLQLGDVLQQLNRDGHITMVSEHARLDGTAFPVAFEAITTRSLAGDVLYRIAWYEDLTEQRVAETARREAHEMFEAAFADAPNGVALIGLDSRFLRVNLALCEMLGRTPEELVGAEAMRFSHPDDQEAARAAYASLSTTMEPISLEKRFVRPDGTVVWAFCRGIAVHDGHGTPRYIVSHFLDFTARTLAQDRQEEANQRFETAFAEAPIGMALVALNGGWIRVNRTLCELTGFAEPRLLELNSQDITHPDDLAADLRNVRRLMTGEIDRYRMEKRYLACGNLVVWINQAVSLVRGADGKPMHFIVQVEDISERKRLAASLQRLADHDSLTELWNRRRFGEELDRQLGRCHRYRERAALLLVDLDGFKQVNDHHGHRAGDELLTCVARALRTRLRSTDSLARLGGDEFGVILANVSPAQATELAAALRDVVSASGIRVNATEVRVTASVGVAPLDFHTASDEEALEQADTAMYRDKAAHGHGSRGRREPYTIRGSAEHGEYASVGGELETLAASGETEASEHDRTVGGQ
jgi:diguanylate cyclase (GGDEF)-like protein/PAS domain S-box-containing protein